MPRQAYLNELSFANGRVSADDGRTLFEQLFQLLRAIDRRCKGVTVVGHCSLAELTIGRCSVGVWLRDDPDRRRLLRAIDNRAPFDADMARLADEMAAALEYRYGDREAIGLGLASWHDGLAVSVDVAPWRTEAVRLLRHQVFEDDDGELAEETVNVRARNAADAAHLQAHDDWLQAPTRNLPRTPDELWLNRDLWYPNIDFIARVERQIRGLPANSPGLRQIAEKLLALQDTLSAWHAASSPEWRINVKPENENREKHCWFEDLDGERRLFELHVNYTPGPNRIHFRLDAPARRIVVAHVGRKLGI